jgi:hypothetical protein
MAEPNGNLAEAAPAVSPEVARLQAELLARNTYVHELHLKLADEHAAHAIRVADLQLRVERALRDTVDLIGKLQAAEDERDALKLQVAALQQPETPPLAAAWRALRGRRRKIPAVPAPASATGAVPPAAFTYHLHPSPFRVFREPTFTLQGWAFPSDGRPVTALRARVDEREFFGTYGLPAPEVAARFGPQAENPQPGFKIVIETPPGRHRLSLEARVGGDDWGCILSLPIWVQPSAG